MTDPQDGGGQETLALRRALELFAPNAFNVTIVAVNHFPAGALVVDYRADLPDGSKVYAPQIIFSFPG